MLYVAWVVLHRNYHIGASERRQLTPHVRFQVPFLGPESQLKSGFACAGLLCKLAPADVYANQWLVVVSSCVRTAASKHRCIMR